MVREAPSAAEALEEVLWGLGVVAAALTATGALLTTAALEIATTVGVTVPAVNWGYYALASVVMTVLTLAVAAEIRIGRWAVGRYRGG